jgi:hypothetical protein
MKKIAYFLIELLTVTLLLSSAAVAHDKDWGGYGHDWGYRHGNYGWGHHRHGHQGWGGYPRREINNYYPAPQASYYYQQPPVYYQPRPQYYPSQSQYYGGGRYCDNRFR